MGMDKENGKSVLEMGKEAWGIQRFTDLKIRAAVLT